MYILNSQKAPGLTENVHQGLSDSLSQRLISPWLGHAPWSPPSLPWCKLKLVFYHHLADYKSCPGFLTHLNICDLVTGSVTFDCVSIQLTWIKFKIDQSVKYKSLLWQESMMLSRAPLWQQPACTDTRSHAVSGPGKGDNQVRDLHELGPVSCHRSRVNISQLAINIRSLTVVESIAILKRMALTSFTDIIHNNLRFATNSRGKDKGVIKWQ